MSISPFFPLSPKTQVKRYGSRQAQIRNYFLELPREMVEDFEKSLNEACGMSHSDNHVTFELVYVDMGMRHVTYIWFHDHMAYFAKEAKVGAY